MPYRKRLIMSCCVLLLTVQLFAQTEPDITGLWKGSMYNDTTQKFLKYEIAISEKKGKLSGYTHTYFILDDKEYHGVKKTKIKKQDGKIIIEDVELIANNYPIPPAKGVHQLNVLTLEIKDGLMTLSGPFSTNRTKLYSTLTGNIMVQRKTNFSQSAQLPHLEELGLVDELSFVREEKLKQIVAFEKTRVIEKPVIVNEAKPVEPAKVPKAVTQPLVKNQQINKPAEIKPTPLVKKQPVAPAVVKATEPATAKNNPVTDIKNADVKTEATKKPVQAELTTITKAEPVKTNVVVQAAADIENRTIEIIQSVNYASDSLVLTLYDNGEIDGDTVSVLMNGDIIMPRVGLSTNAIRKTIYTKDIKDSIKIVMYAENLGSLPPNTGLLIVYDGTDRYEIRFSGDLKKNAAIVFRKKEN